MTGFLDPQNNKEGETGNNGPKFMIDTEVNT